PAFRRTPTCTSCSSGASAWARRCVDCSGARRRTCARRTRPRSPSRRTGDGGEVTMSAAEVGARLTPYELAFADTPFEAEGFPAIREEAEARGVDDTTPERFLLLAEVGRLLRELDAPGASLEPMGMLLFHSYHFRSEEHTSELQSRENLVCRLLLEKK